MIDNSEKPNFGDEPPDMSGLLGPSAAAQRELQRRVTAMVERVRRLEDVEPIAKQLLDEGYRPGAAAQLLFDGFSAARQWDGFGGYSKCRTAILRAVGFQQRERWDWPDVLASWQK